MCVTFTFVSHAIINGMVYVAKDVISNGMVGCKPFHLRDWISVPSIFPCFNQGPIIILHIIKLVVVCIHSPCDIFSLRLSAYGCLCMWMCFTTFLTHTRSMHSLHNLWPSSDFVHMHPVDRFLATFFNSFHYHFSRFLCHHFTGCLCTAILSTLAPHPFHSALAFGCIFIVICRCADIYLHSWWILAGIRQNR